MRDCKMVATRGVGVVVEKIKGWLLNLRGGGVWSKSSVVGSSVGRRGDNCMLVTVS